MHSLKESFDRDLAASMILSSPRARTAVLLFTVPSTPVSLPRSGRKIRMQCWEVASRSETSFTVRHLESLFADFRCLGSQVLDTLCCERRSDSQIHNFLESSPPTHPNSSRDIRMCQVFFAASKNLRQSFLL